jgi:hypothetical protein
MYKDYIPVFFVQEKSQRVFYTVCMLTLGICFLKNANRTLPKFYNNLKNY